MLRFIHIVLASLVFLLIGCSTRYMVGEETFYSSTEALQKIETVNANMLKDITPTTKPLHGTALVVIPSDIEIQRNYIGYLGNLSTIDKANMEFMITATRKNFQVAVDAIKKRGIFDSVSVANHDGNPASFPIRNYNFMVFRDVDGWFIRGANNPKPLLIQSDAGKKVTSNRILTFLEALSQRADTIHRE